MRSADRGGYFLHAPVTAVAIGSRWICCAVGNRVLAGDIHRLVATSPFGGESESDWDLQLVAELPHGAVITALEQHIVHDGASHSDTAAVVVVIGSGDCVFFTPLGHKKPHGDNRFRQPLMEASARILLIRSLGPGSGVVVVTAIHSAHVVCEANFAMTATSAKAPVSLRYAVTGLGVALAADAVMESGGKSVAVFSGTYAGSIAAWRLPVVDTHKQAEDGKNSAVLDALPVISRIRAHRPGCAVFGVKVICAESGGTGDGMSFYVATCSDDRTATLYTTTKPTTMLTDGLEWTCCWRGTGASFSRRRVFDVSIHFLREKDNGAVLLATGGEDGGVHVLSFGLNQLHKAAVAAEIDGEAVLSVTPSELLHRKHQHDGRGVYRVALTMTPHASGETTNSAALISCGFDGSVHYTPLSCLSSRRATLLPCVARQKRERHVRGLVCDDEGTLLACTEDELIVLSLSAEGRERRLPIPITDMKKDLPSCISVTPLGSRQRQQSGFSLALVGTKGGNVYGARYKPSLLSQEERSKTEEEKGTNAVVRLLAASLVPLASASKVLLLRGLHWQDHVLVVGFYANKVMVLFSLDFRLENPAVVWTVGQCAGVHTTTFLDMCIMAREKSVEEGKEGHSLCVFVGDDHGGLSIHLIDLEDEAHKATTLLQWQRFFEYPIASVIRNSAHMNGSKKRITIVSAQGEWRVLCLDLAARRIDICPVSCPLRLPWRIYSVLSCSETVAVTLLGTDVSVYTRRSSCFSWQLAAEYHGVKAPRLLSAATLDPAALSGGPSVLLCHCSDGVHAEWHTCDASTGTRVCHGGTMTGREYNTALFLPGPTPSFLCGCENSMLTVMPLPYSTVKGVDAPLTLAGPHASNILAMALCGEGEDGDTVRFVTVGGLATLALWESSACHGCRVVAHVEQQQRQKSAGNADYNHDAGEKSNSGGGRSVPRFLSVCVTREDIVVGGSDGVLKVFALDETLELRHAMRPSTCTPKPLLAAATLSRIQRLVVVGDTNGVVMVTNVAEEAVTAACSWTKAAVNAIVVGRQLQRQNWTKEGDSVFPAVSAWRVFAAMDSGDVALLHLSVSSITVMCTLRVGLTSVRGVCWITGQKEEEDAVIAVNEERVTHLQTCDVATKAGRMEKLCVVGHTRVNIRGVSGLAVAAAATMPSHVVLVVGEGMEALPLCVDGGGLRSK